MPTEKIGPDWKQWIPVWGIYQHRLDSVAGIPCILGRATYDTVEDENINDSHRFFWAQYQALSVGAVVVWGANGLIKLLS